MAIDPVFEKSLIDEFMFITINQTAGLGSMTAAQAQVLYQMLQATIDRAYSAGYQDGLAGAAPQPPFPSQ